MNKRATGVKPGEFPSSIKREHTSLKHLEQYPIGIVRAIYGRILRSIRQKFWSDFSSTDFFSRNSGNIFQIPYEVGASANFGIHSIASSRMDIWYKP